MTRKLILFVVLLLVSIPAFAENIGTAWVKRYNGPGDWEDWGKTVMVDASGYVYVTGTSSSFGTRDDYLTVKYDSSGNQLWVSRYDASTDGWDQVFAMTIDAFGNVYVTGVSHGTGTGEDYATVKYNPDGDTAWVRRYYGTETGVDYAFAVAVDDSGNVYVSGESSGDGTSLDYATVKYDRHGNEVWVRRYNGPGNYADWAKGVVVDDSGYVYVTGASKDTSARPDFATIKYDSSGNEIWVTRYNGPGDSTDWACAMAIDDSANIYVTGWSIGSGTDYDYATIKYDSSGYQQWARRYNGPGNGEDWPWAIAVDAFGNAYVAGYSQGTGTGEDYVTVKYDKNGNEEWVKRYNGTANSDDKAYDIAVDFSGNVYVTGESRGAHTDVDYATLKYDPAGNQLWIKRYNAPVNLYDVGLSIALDNSGNVYVTGTSDGGATRMDYATIKYSPFIAPRGDVNGDEEIALADVVYLINYVLKSGIPPEPVELGDANCDGNEDITDIVYLINYVFRGGPPPC